MRIRGPILLLGLMLAACGTATSTATTLEPATTNTTPGTNPWAFAEQAVQVYADCMGERGFVVTLDGRGGSQLTLPPGQEDEGTAADEECSSLASQSQGPPRMPTEEELEERYVFLLETKTCLEEIGYPITSPPSLESFVESIGANWYPHGEVAPRDQDEWNAINDHCPQF